MKKEKWDGHSRPSNDRYRKNFNEIFGNKPSITTMSNTGAELLRTTFSGNRTLDLKGTVFCKAKKCENHLYKNESDRLPGYCQECG